MADLRDILTGIMQRRIPDTTLPVGTVAAAGTYEAPFQSGSIQLKGADGSLNGLGDFQYGLNLPNASGIPGPGLLLSGAGKSQVAIIQDEQLPGQKGITLIIEAGDASTSGAANDDSGDFLDFAGGTLYGNGGTRKMQGGTSVHAAAGPSIVHGGNSTDGTPGPAVMEAGETGTAAGANCQYIATQPPGAPAYGVHRFQFNSNFMCEFHDLGQLYLYNGNGYGLAGQPVVSSGPGGPLTYQVGFTGVITTAKLTSLGSNGSMTFASGILISQVQAT